MTNTGNHNFTDEEKIIVEVKNSYKEIWKNYKDVSKATKNASEVTKHWQKNVINSDSSRYKSEERVSESSREKIDIVDISDSTAYELKVSKNNPNHEFYKDIFKVLAYNKNNPQNKIKKLIFITSSIGFKDKCLPQIITEWCNNENIGFTIAIADYINE